MKFKLFITSICWIAFYGISYAEAQPLYDSRDWQSPSQLSPRQNLPSNLSSISQFSRFVETELQQKSPFFYQFLIELENYQSQQQLNLQQQAEIELQKQLNAPQPLQKRLMEQQ